MLSGIGRTYFIDGFAKTSEYDKAVYAFVIS